MRVGKVIQKLGYTPWTTARNFSLGRAGCVGLVMETTQGQWMTQILGGIEAELTSKHLSLLVGSLVLRERYDSATVSSWIRDRRVDGIIFVGPKQRERQLVESARRAGIAVVLIEPDDEFAGYEVFRSDNVAAGKAIAEHLFQLGHRRIAFVGGPQESVDTRQRLEGLTEGLAAFKVKLPESQVIFARFHKEAGVEYGRRWLRTSRSRAPTAVVLGNDIMAVGFMRTLQAAGVEIPKDVSVVGFDDTPAASMYWPGLTTVRQEMREMGEAACRFLLTSVEGKSSTGRTHEFPMSLVPRESTGPTTNSQ
jgi:DNA-binding LacI/PurR family transcriptional regulator